MSRADYSSNPSDGSQPRAKDWSAAQYLKFGDQRTRAVRDLVAQLPFSSPSSSPKRIVDLGCGPGNSTAVLAARFPDAHISGVDSSPDMLVRAKRVLPGVDFSIGGLLTWEPGASATTSTDPDGGLSSTPVDLFFANAVFHWLRHADRIPTIQRLIRTQKPGGVFAFQVPDNHSEPSHRAMREVAAAEGRSWSKYFPWYHHRAANEQGDLQIRHSRPDLDPIEPPREFYDALIPLCSSVDIWHTSYNHVLPGGPADIIEWVKGTGLQPFLHALPEVGGAREEFLAAYEERLAEAYPRLADGQVMLRYPRLFLVAVRK